MLNMEHFKAMGAMNMGDLGKAKIKGSHIYFPLFYIHLPF